MSYLATLKREDANPDTGEAYADPKWVIDEDSAHHFKDKSDGWQRVELVINKITPIRG